MSITNLDNMMAWANDRKATEVLVKYIKISVVAFLIACSGLSLKKTNATI